MNFGSFKDVENEPSPSPSDVNNGESQENSDSEDGQIVTAEHKPVNRTAVTLFVIIAISALATYLMQLRTGPATAQASDPASINAEATINDFMRGGTTNITLFRKMLDGTSHLIDQLNIFGNVAQIPLSDLKVNPFQLHQGTAVVDDTSLEARRQKDEHHAVILKEAQGLQLQSIFVGSNRRSCMINNKMCREGDKIGSFAVQKIASNYVWVRCESYQYELRMQGS